MKKCPKCGKMYDNSWDICLLCSVSLVIDPSAPKVDLDVQRPQFKDKREPFEGKFWTGYTFTEKIRFLIYISIVLSIFYYILIGPWIGAIFNPPSYMDEADYEDMRNNQRFP